MPSIQWIIQAAFSSDQVTVIGVNNTSSILWLKNYRGQTAISYPLVFDQQSDLFRLYQVGGSFGNVPPSYVIIDKAGTVRYRIDKEYNRFQEMKTVVEQLLKK